MNGSKPPMNKPMITFGSVSENWNANGCAVARDVRFQFFHVGAKQNERGQSGGSDGVTFGHRFHRVADRVELSVTLRTSLGKLLMTAMPPALSVIGPKESSEMMIPAMDNIAITAMAIP